MAALPTYLPLPEAARRLNIPEDRLRSLVSSGRMKAVEVNGEIAVSEESVNKLPPPKEKRQPITLFHATGIFKNDLPEYRKFSHLAGNEIWLSEASRKYAVSLTTMSGWVKSGLIGKLGADKNRLLLNEQDVAYCAEIYHRNAGQGKWLFNKDGTPYLKN